MNVSIYYQDLSTVMKQRNLLLLLAGLFLVMNVILSFSLIVKKERIVIVPPLLEKSFWTQGGLVSTSYLEELSGWLGHLMLDKNTTNMKTHHKQLLKYIAPEQYQTLLKTLLKDEARYVSDGLSTSFAIQQYETNKDKMEVILKGVLDIKVGSKSISRIKKTYLIKYKYAYGKLYLWKFREVGHEVL